MLRTFLQSLQPDQDSLLSEISKHITDEMLTEIAQADYGQNQEQHLAPLRLLRSKGIFIEPMHWYPCEVLELVRNSEPDNSPALNRVHEHWLRAFACAALFRAKGQPYNYTADPASPSFTLIQLLDSLEALPSDFTLNAVRLLAWMMLQSDLDHEDEQTIYCGVCLLWLALLLSTPPSDQELVELAEWIVCREEDVHRKRWSAFDRWLLGIGKDPPPSRWEQLGRRLARINLSGHADELQEWVSLIGVQLAGDAATERMVGNPVPDEQLPGSCSFPACRLYAHVSTRGRFILAVDWTSETQRHETERDAA